MNQTQNNTLMKHRDRIISILNRPLKPDNFKNYALDALSELITYLHQIFESSDEYKGDEYNSSIENDILVKLGFAGDQIIENLSIKVEQIANILQLSGSILNHDSISDDNHKIGAAIFLLVSEFGVNISDKNQFEIRKGYSLPSRDMGSPYCIISAPVVNVTIVISNDIDNPTFVFNNKKLRENKIFSNEIYNSSYSQEKLASIVDSSIGMGIIITSHDDLIPCLISSIKSSIYHEMDQFHSSKYDKTSPVSLLKNKSIQEIPEGYVFLFDFADRLGINIKILNFLIDSSADKIGEIKLYKLYIGSVEPCLSIEQQNLLKEIYDSFATIPEGYIGVESLKQKLGIDSQTFFKLIESYDGEFGAVIKYKMNSGSIDDCLNPKQIEIINTEYSKYPAKPSNYVAINTLSKQISVDVQTLKKLIKNTGNNFGEIKLFRLPIGKIEECLSPEQVILLTNNQSTSKKIPPGFIPLGQFAKTLGITEESISEIVLRITNELGPIDKYETATLKIESCISPIQQDTIRAAYNKFETIPEGYKAISIFCAENSYEISVVHRMIEALDGHIGDIKKYRTSTGKIEECLSLEQQQQLIDLLKL